MVPTTAGAPELGKKQKKPYSFLSVEVVFSEEIVQPFTDTDSLDIFQVGSENGNSWMVSVGGHIMGVSETSAGPSSGMLGGCGGLPTPPGPTSKYKRNGLAIPS